MSRRRMVVLASAAIILGIVAFAVIGLALLTRTGFGREQIRRFALGRIASAVHGKLYVGKLGGSILGDITVDSLELRSEDDSLFLASGPAAVRFDARDLLDMRVMLFDLRLTNPVVNINIDSAGTVNFRKIFPPGKPGPVRTTRGWGDYIAVRNATIRNLTLRVTMPWTPDTTLRGTRRDSAIKVALGGKDRIVRRVGNHFVQTQQWTNGSLTLDSARLDDRSPQGRFFSVANLDLIGYAPPFNVKNVRGTARMAGDSLWFDAPHLDLPASTGSAKGKIWWGSGAPVRYDLVAVGDSVSLNDINWVYPTLPRTGGGKMKLLMRSEKDPRVVDYVVTDMDVHSTQSWLRGKMTWSIGGPVTVLKDVDLIAQPVDFQLIETLVGEPLPYPFRGTLTGTVQARGGPLDHWVVDASDIVFRDANVPGATAIARGRGELDILEPSNTAFHDFFLELDQLDLRTVQFLNPSFPRFNGIIAGRVTLDSTYLDLRFRQADLTHSDGTGPVTHVTGAGRVTFAENTTYDIALAALPLSFTTIRRAYVGGHVPLRGEYSGPLRLEGTLQDLAVSTDLRGPSGAVAYDGRVDSDSVGGYGAHGALRFTGLDLRTFLDTAITPTTELTGTSDLDIVGDSLANLSGTVTIDLDRSLVDSVRIYPSRTRLRFADSRMFVDTLGVQSAIASLTAHGALGLSGDIRDSLLVHFTADSLGGLRRYLIKPAAIASDGSPLEGEGDAPVDSLQGVLSGDLALFGSFDTLGVNGTARASEVRAMGVRANTVNMRVLLDDVTGNRHGTIRLSADTMSAGGIQLDSARAELALDDSTSGTYSASVTAKNGPTVSSGGAIRFDDDTTIARVQRLSLAIREHRLELSHEAIVSVSRRRVTADTLRLVGEKGEGITLALNLPDSGDISGLLRVDSVHMADVSDLAQLRVPLGGGLSGSIEARGTKSAPIVDLHATVTGGKVGQVNIARIALDGHYADKRMNGGLRVVQQDTTVLNVTANLPMNLSGAILDDTMRVAVRAQDVDMRLLESFSNKITHASGRFSAVLDAAGPKGARFLDGQVRIANGTASFPDAGVALRDITADIQARHDSVLISRFSMVSGDQPNNRLSVGGSVAHPLDSLPYFDLVVSANQFHALGNRKLADLYISTSPDLQFTGTASGDTLTGTVIVNRGVVFMPEPTDKQIITLQNADLVALGLDTAAAARLRLLPRTTSSAYVQNLVVRGVNIVMGSDVSVRSVESREINIKLGGQVAVNVRGLGGSRPQLVLDGSLQTERGRYVLNLANVFQRTFEIESGTMTFFGESEFNPTVNISAVYTSRQISSTYGGRNDLRIRARVTGTFLAPKVSLESADSLNIEQSDLISYLISGTPSFEIGGTFRQNYGQLSAIVLGSAASYLAARLSGGLFDYVEVQTAADRFGASNAQQQSEVGLFAGTQLGIGKQLNDRTFVALSTGVCKLFGSSSQRGDWTSLASSLGVKAELQLKKDVGVSASVEPSLSSLLCTENNFSTSVRQLGFDLFRTIRW